MPKIEFSSRVEANKTRDIPAVERRLAPDDDRRTRTVVLSSSTPDRVVERVEERALATQRAESKSRGMRELSSGERRSLERGHSGWSWRGHGLEAMRTKAALESRGVTEWLDYYEPGEGIGGALANLESTKEASARTGGDVGMTHDYTDEEELVDRGEVARQTAEARSAGVDRAIEPALLEGDRDAQEFLREEQEFGADVFDISFGGGLPSGRDYERLEERHARRSPRARSMDSRLQAPMTRDPIKWANNPNRWDFPGLDELDPDAIHASRSERARAVDEARAAPYADSAEEWAERPDELDLAGVDDGVGFSVEETGQAGLGGEVVDRDPQAAFDIEADVRHAQGRESRVEEPAASEFGVDDRVLDDRGGFDETIGAGLEAFGGGARENEELGAMLDVFPDDDVDVDEEGSIW